MIHCARRPKKQEGARFLSSIIISRVVLHIPLIHWAGHSPLSDSFSPGPGEPEKIARWYVSSAGREYLKTSFKFPVLCRTYYEVETRNGVILNCLDMSHVSKSENTSHYNWHPLNEAIAGEKTSDDVVRVRVLSAKRRATFARIIFIIRRLAPVFF